LGVILTRDQAAAVDEFGELARRVETFENLAAFQKYEKSLKRREELKALIASWYDKEPADKAFVADGKLWSVPVSERAPKREIVDMAALYKELGETKFLLLCGFRLEDADRHVSEQVRQLAIRKDRIGKRTLGRPLPLFPTVDIKPVKKLGAKPEKLQQKKLAA
jgi:hypothetical protein